MVRDRVGVRDGVRVMFWVGIGVWARLHTQPRKGNSDRLPDLHLDPGRGSGRGSRIFYRNKIDCLQQVESKTFIHKKSENAKLVALEPGSDMEAFSTRIVDKGSTFYSALQHPQFHSDICVHIHSVDSRILSFLKKFWPKKH